MLLLYLSEERMTGFPSAWPHQRKQFTSSSSVIFTCRRSQFVQPPVWALAKFHITTVYLFSLRFFLTLNFWDKIQGEGRSCMFYCSPQTEKPVTLNLQEKILPLPSKNHKEDWRHCPSSENSDSSKKARSATQFKVGKEQSCAREQAGV